MLHDAPIFRHRVNTLDRCHKLHLHHLQPTDTLFSKPPIGIVDTYHRNEPVDHDVRKGPRWPDSSAFELYHHKTCRDFYNYPHRKRRRRNRSVHARTKTMPQRGLSWVDTHPLTRLDPFMDFMMASFLHLIQIIATHWFSLFFRSSQARSSSQAAAGEFYA